MVRPDKRFSNGGRRNDVFGFWTIPRTIARREGEEVHGAPSDPGEGDPPRAGGKGSAGVRPDRDREDRGLRASHPAKAQPVAGRTGGTAGRPKGKGAGVSSRSRSGAHSHEGTGHPGRGE